MAEPQFQIVDIPGIGQREVPANLKGADLDKFVQQIIQLESPQVTTDADIPAFTAPTVQVTQDIPTDENLAPTPQAPQRPMSQEFMRRAAQIPQNIVGSAEAAATLGTGMLSTLGGTLAGIVKEPFTGEPAEQTAQRIQQGLTYTPRTEAGQRITQDVAGALGVFEGLPPYAPVPTRTFPTLTGVQPKGRIPTKGVPTMDELAAESSRLYGVAEQSGVKFKTPQFKTSMQNIAKELRKEEGFTTTGYPKLAGAVQELTDIKQPKDFTELQALRKIVKGSTRSADPQEALLGMKLLNKFDDYLINAPEKDFAIKSAEGLKAWRDARATYSKMKKAEIFDDMIANAELGAEKIPVDRALRNSLIKLSQDKDTMRFFTPTEQNRINSLVKFEATNPKAYAQRVLSVLGTVAPRFTAGTGLRTGAYGLGAGAELAQGGLPLTTLGIGAGSKIAEIGAEALRKGGIQDLARLSRAGGYELAPIRTGLGITLPTGSEFYGAGGLLSNVLEEQTR
jgi:hypothetical protein